MKVVFNIVNGQVSIEGDGPDLISVLQAVRDVAPKLTEIRLITAPTHPKQIVAGAGSHDVPTEENKVNLPPAGGAPTLREFVKQVGPESVADRIVALGFYHSRYQGEDSFSPKQMEQWFDHAGLVKPAQMPVAIFAARKRYGYVDSPSHGRWKVTVAGENAITRKLSANGGSEK